MDAKTVEQLTASSDSGTSLGTISSVSSATELSGSSNLPNSESVSSSLSMKSNGSSLGGAERGASGDGSESRTGTPKNLGKFRQFYKSAFLALSQTSDFDQGKSIFDYFSRLIYRNSSTWSFKLLREYVGLFDCDY